MRITKNLAGQSCRFAVIFWRRSSAALPVEMNASP